jgi:dienelactone hydrolase
MGAHIRAGRAVFAVVFDGMIERPLPPGTERPASHTVAFRDLMVLHATQLRMGMDYLETRADIDPARLAYFGSSWGAGSRLVFAAVDDRTRAVVLLGAGIDERVQPTLPEAANFNFAPYIRAPTLMVNGRQDEEHPWTTRAKPLWDILPEPKELVLIEGAGHHPPLELRAAPINDFLDRTLGPVRWRTEPER